MSHRENKGRDGFLLASFFFGLVALVTWQWTAPGVVVAIMAVGFGIVAFWGKRSWAAGIAIFLGLIGLLLSLTTAFLNWP